MNYIIRYIRGHYEVYDKNGRFVFSADSYAEVYQEIDRLVA